MQCDLSGVPAGETIKDRWRKFTIAVKAALFVAQHVRVGKKKEKPEKIYGCSEGKLSSSECV